MEVIAELAICADCLFWFDYGDESLSDSDRTPDEFRADVRRTLGEDVNHVVVTGEELGFSWSACESCGSTLGGDRFRAVILV